MKSSKNVGVNACTTQRSCRTATKVHMTPKATEGDAVCHGAFINKSQRFFEHQLASTWMISWTTTSMSNDSCVADAGGEQKFMLAACGRHVPEEVV
jgi:hypothetical protein